MRWRRGEPRPEGEIVFDPPLLGGTLLGRRKRFFADVELDTGERIVAHTNNTGAMLGVSSPGQLVQVSPLPPDPKRKLHYLLEMVQTQDVWVGVNTLLPNRLAARAVLAGRLRPLAGHDELRTEAAFPTGNGRVDLLLTRDTPPRRTWVEVKNVTLADRRTALFPDAVTARGLKHLHELAQRARQGDRAVMLFLVQRADCTHLAPAAHIDPDYARTLTQVAARRVEILAYRTRVTPAGVSIDRKLPFRP